MGTIVVMGAFLALPTCCPRKEKMHGQSFLNPPRRRSGPGPGSRRTRRRKTRLRTSRRALCQSPRRDPDSGKPLLSEKLLDAKVRLHRRLIEEINLSALEKLPEEEMRKHVQRTCFAICADRYGSRSMPQELDDFASEILDEMTGLGPLEPLLKDPSRQRHPHQRP